MFIDLNAFDFILMAHRYVDQDFTLESNIYSYSGIWGIGDCDHIMKVTYFNVGNLNII